MRENFLYSCRAISFNGQICSLHDVLIKKTARFAGNLKNYLDAKYSKLEIC